MMRGANCMRVCPQDHTGIIQPTQLVHAKSLSQLNSPATGSVQRAHLGLGALPQQHRLAVQPVIHTEVARLEQAQRVVSNRQAAAGAAAGQARLAAAAAGACGGGMGVTVGGAAEAGKHHTKATKPSQLGLEHVPCCLGHAWQRF